MQKAFTNGSLFTGATRTTVSREAAWHTPEPSGSRSTWGGGAWKETLPGHPASSGRRETPQGRALQAAAKHLRCGWKVTSGSLSAGLEGRPRRDAAHQRGSYAGHGIPRPSTMAGSSTRSTALPRGAPRRGSYPGNRQGMAEVLGRGTGFFSQGVANEAGWERALCLPACHTLCLQGFLWHGG